MTVDSNVSRFSTSCSRLNCLDATRSRSIIYMGMILVLTLDLASYTAIGYGFPQDITRNLLSPNLD
jgi:hypothetical protein